MNAPNASLDTRITTDLPAMIEGPIPVEPYVSAEFFEREREAIFKRAWLNLCRAEDLPEVGDFKVFEVEIWNASILLVRGKDGALRAFHNTCTHRGNQVAARYGCEGNTRTFVAGPSTWTAACAPCRRRSISPAWTRIGSACCRWPARCGTASCS